MFKLDVIWIWKWVISMAIDFNADAFAQYRPYVDWVAIRVGNLDPETVVNDLKHYDLTVEEVKTMTDYDLDYHLNKYGVDYMLEKHEYDQFQSQEERLSNGGLSDEELMQRFEDAMYGHTGGEYDSSFGLDY